MCSTETKETNKKDEKIMVGAGSKRLAKSANVNKPFVVTISTWLVVVLVVSSFIFPFMLGRYCYYSRVGAYDDAGLIQAINSIISPQANSRHHSTPIRNSTKTTKTCPNNDVTAAANADEQLQHSLPGGQHLIVDIENVDTKQLDSGNKIKNVLHQLFNEIESKLLLVSDCYHTKELAMCFGVSQDTHATFHVWPTKGIALIDIFAMSTQPKSFAHPGIAPVLGRLFRAPIQSTEESEADGSTTPNVNWRFKKRGPVGENNIALSPQEKVTTQPMTIAPEDIQRRLFREAAYNEALVHPVMFLNDNPERVAIIGGSLGTSLRETLKHNTVKEVVVIGADMELIQTAKENLPQLFDCSNLLGSTHSCFDDPRVKLIFEDAASWFEKNYDYDDEEDVNQKTLFDVIIVDIHPDNSFEYLLKNEYLLDYLSISLRDDGVMAVPADKKRSLAHHPMSQKQELRKNFLSVAEEAGFENAVDFTEAHSRLGSSQSFIAVMKDEKSGGNWLSNEATVNLQIQRRSSNTVTAGSPFHFFDSTTMMSYKFPSRIDEEIYCRSDPRPEDCSGHGFDPDRIGFPASSFEVRHSAVGDRAGRGIFAKERVPAGSFIGVDDCVNGMYVSHTATSLLYDMQEKVGLPYWKTLVTGYLDGYGWSDSEYGVESSGIDPGILTFMNHGCNGTYNSGTKLNVTELNADPEVSPLDSGVNFYEPVSIRHFPMWGCGSTAISLNDIEKGEEVLDNYLVFHGASAQGWKENLAELRMWCSGESVGTVTEYENE